MSPPLPPGNRIAARALAVGVGVLLAAWAMARGFIVLLERSMDRETQANITEGAERIQDFLQELPALAAREDAALVFGSSLIQHGFSPEVFEAHVRGPRVTAYNLGFPGVDPEVQRLLAHRVAEAFQRSGHRARLTVVEFTPFQATLARGRSAKFSEMANVKRAMLATPGDLVETALRSPEEASHLAALQALGGNSPLAITSMLEHQLFADPAPADPERQELVARMRAGRERVEQRRVRAWDPVRRGEARLFFDETREDYLAWVRLRTTPEILEQNLEWRVWTSDLLELHFDERKVAAFAEAVRTLAGVSERTVLLLAPRNRAWVQLTPEGRSRLAEVVARLSRDTGVPVVDLSEALEFTPEDFIDVTHLNESSGRPRLSRRLAEELSPPAPPLVGPGTP
ncbi:SGNH/GDSL hydrolase family protein [Archangium minus]|uniref:SGNH/GDSL hydrolase family protein n=1 Tax=Archangium minus TaxID=83450 RepID=A0ABY9WRX1_9BACT|nr:SGNH/GDSL hydrolase family protein [Archangium minus]